MRTRPALLIAGLLTSSCNAILGVTPGESREGTDDAGASAPECVRHVDCMTAGAPTDQKICRSGRCVPFLQADCPFALPSNNEWLDSLRAPGPEPLIVGVFHLISNMTQITTGTRNYELVIKEITETLGGLPVAEGARPIVALVCEAQLPDRARFDAALDHLVDEVGVPAILTSMATDDLAYVFERARQKRVFFLNALGSDPTLLALHPDGLLWHLLPGFESVSLAYQPLLDRTLRYLAKNGSLADGESPRVALVGGTGRVDYVELTHLLLDNLQIEGKRIADVGADHFQLVQVETLDSENPAPDYSDALRKLRDFRPHLIIATATTEFERHFIPALEGDTSKPRPFYVLPPWHAHSAKVHDLVFNSGAKNLYARIAGVNYAAAEDPTAYVNYQDRFDARYSGMAGSSAGFENYYDAPYYLFYAAAAAGNVWPLSGDDLVRGMRRLLDGGAAYGVGPDDLPLALPGLAMPESESITLNGTMGPPDFDPATGVRIQPGSVWCIDASATYHYDALRLNDQAELVGTFPCFDFEAP